MEISGRIITVLQKQTGQSAKGGWQKQDFVIETPGEYPKKVALSLWGAKVDECPIKVGDQITASINLESREYSGRWYTEARVWKLDKKGSSGGGLSNTPPPQQQQQNNTAPPVDYGSDDLPF
jgi:hypothetical protein